MATKAQQATARIDQALDDYRFQDIIRQAELLDILLDVRNLLQTAPKKSLPV